MSYYKFHIAQFFGGSRPSWAGPFFDAGDDGGGGAAGGDDGNVGAAGTDGGNQKTLAEGGDSGGDRTGGKDDATGGAGKDEGEAGAEGEGEGGEQNALTPESFTLPEGYAFRDEDAKSFMDILSDKALTDKDKAQKFIELHCKVLGDYTAGLDASSKEAAAADAKAKADQEAAWLDECKADADIGGRNWERSQSRYERVVSDLKLEPLHETMSAMGMQNYPEYLKPILGLYDLIAEDRRGGGKASGGRKSDREVFYGPDAAEQ